MNGSESLVRSLVASGVEVCFANPGTSEMHFVSALDRVDGIRPILCLFEGVATGAADGYGRMLDRPACTLLHLGPGLGNGLANLHNARRANTPIVNIVGDHATYHAAFDAPLTSDIIGLARTVSGWVTSSPSAKTVAADGARAVQAARQAPGQIATLILPADTAWNEADRPAAALSVQGPATVEDQAIAQAVAALRSGKKTALLLGGKALLRRGLDAAGRIAAATGARLLCNTQTARIERGAGLVAVTRIPYPVDQATAFLSEFACIILVGGKPPVAFFAYPDKPSRLTPDGCEVIHLSHPHEDGPAALEAVAAALGAPREPAGRAMLERPALPVGGLDPMNAGRIVAHYLPENAILSDESGTTGIGPTTFNATAPPHDHLTLTGGSIGQGLPLAVGAAVACPDRKVICLEADGSGMYTLQALWTMAREKLNVTIVVWANRSYAMLRRELAAVGGGNPGRKALSMLDLGDPNLDWVGLAQGMGVEASRAETSEAFADQLQDAIAARGPRLIEAVVS